MSVKMSQKNLPILIQEDNYFDGMGAQKSRNDFVGSNGDGGVAQIGK